MFKGLVILLWSICIVIAVEATAQTFTGTPDSPWGVAVFWWAVVAGTFIWHHGGWLGVKCFFGWHEWSMTRGYDGMPHHTAVCNNCGSMPKEYN